MIRATTICCFAVFVLGQATAWAQFPEPAPEHKILKKDIGTWTASIKMWMGPDGKADPNATPQTSKGQEVNRMLGQFWVLSTFKGEFGGMPFEGHSTNGYDPKAKKFVGSWVDSVSPSAMHMSGTYDEKTETLTSTSHGVGMDGQEVTGKITVKYEGKNKRVMTMYESVDGKDVKSMQIVYERVSDK